MSKKQLLALLLLFVAYLLLGATIFYHIERAAEKVARIEEIAERDEIIDLVEHNYLPGNTSAQRDFLEKLSDLCNIDMTDPSPADSSPEPQKWTFYNSFFFVITVVSTIGYGNLSPTTDLGRVLMILYALIGIPMQGILLASLGDFYSRALVKIHKRYKSKEDQYRYHSRTWLITDTLSYLIPGMVVFIFLPAAVFTYMENNWDYIMSVYYAFVTLTTIGFGDLVAGQTNMGFDSGWFLVYQIMLVVWVIFGLGYVAMILGFIARGMRSKRMARLEHRLAHNIKVTQSRLWNGIAKDAVYLRRVLNEMYLQKIRPVYKDGEPLGSAPLQSRSRSNSDPCLRRSFGSGDLEDDAIGRLRRRRRANSDFPRVLSDSDLGRIDRAATFASAAAAVVQPAELLARVVDVLGAATMPASDSDSLSSENKDTFNSGIHGFTDSEILASEKTRGSVWTLGGLSLSGSKPPKFRARAASEVKIPMYEPSNFLTVVPGGYNAEWTWTGGLEPSKRVHELYRHKSSHQGKKKKQQPPPPDLLDVEAQLAPPPVQTTFQRISQAPRALLNRLRRPSAIPSADKLKPPPSLSKRMSLPSPQLGLWRHPSDDQYRTIAAGLLGSPEDMRDVDDVLEETSLADFLRALSSVHSRVGGTTWIPPDRPRRKSSVGPPSLQALFTPLSGMEHSYSRRGSLKPPATNIGSTTAAPRRFSLRPATPPVAQLAQRRSSLRPPQTQHTPPPPLGGRRPSIRPTRSQDRRRFSVRLVPEGQLSVPPSLPPGVRSLRQQVLQRQVIDSNPLPRRTRHDSLRSDSHTDSND